MDKVRSKIVELRKSGLRYAEIKKIVGCAQSTISYHCKNSGLQDSNSRTKPTTQLIKEWQRYYDTGVTTEQVAKKFRRHPQTIRKYIDKRYRPKQKRTNSENVLAWRQRAVKELREQAGGKCQICGYDRCQRALEFHHIDPKTKEFGIASVSNSFARMKKEAAKCILVCSNCHREIEDKLIDIYGNSIRI